MSAIRGRLELDSAHGRDYRPHHDTQCSYNREMLREDEDWAAALTAEDGQLRRGIVR